MGGNRDGDGLQWVYEPKDIQKPRPLYYSIVAVISQVSVRLPDKTQTAVHDSAQAYPPAQLGWQKQSFFLQIMEINMVWILLVLIIAIPLLAICAILTGLSSVL